MINQYGIKAGLAINPDTDESMLLPFLNKIDLVLIMGVNPGRGGQEFIDETIKKILRIKKIILKKKKKVYISVDGGVNGEVAKRLDFADIIVSGNYVTSSENFEDAIETIRINSSLNAIKGKAKANKKEKKKEVEKEN